MNLGSTLSGLHRWPKEHFSVFVCSPQSARVRQMRAPPLRYYADPFVWTHDGVSALFVEEFDYLRNRGRLRCMTIDRELRAGPAHALVERAGHASFPFVFRHGATLYMVPETCPGDHAGQFRQSTVDRAGGAAPKLRQPSVRKNL